MAPFMPLILILAGLFSIAGAYNDWDFFMNSSRARLFVAMFGRQGARVFYGLLGGVLAIVGVGMFGFV